MALVTQSSVLESTALSVQLGGGDADNLSKTRREWDQRADEADQKQTELFHTQWSLFREQIATFSRELIIIRKVVQKIQEEQVVERQQVQQVTLEHRSMLDLSKEHAQDLARKLEAEVRERESLGLALERRLSESEERAAKHVTQMVAEEAAERRNDDQDLVHKLQVLHDQLQSETATTRSQMEETRGHLSQLNAGVEADRAKNKQTFDDLNAKLAALEKENAARKHESERHTVDIKQTNVDLAALSAALEHEKDARAAKLAALRDELFGETHRQDAIITTLRVDLGKLGQEMSMEVKKTGADFADQIKQVKADLQQEGQQRKADQTQTEQSLKGWRQDLDQERKQRIQNDEEAQGRTKAVQDDLVAQMAARAQAEAQLKEGFEHKNSELMTLLTVLRGDMEKNAVDNDKTDAAAAVQRQQITEEIVATKKEFMTALSEEKKLRAQQDQIFATELSSAHENHQAECAHRTKHMADLSNAFKSVQDNTGSEAQRESVVKPKGAGARVVRASTTAVPSFSR